MQFPWASIFNGVGMPTKEQIMVAFRSMGKLDPDLLAGMLSQMTPSAQHRLVTVVRDALEMLRTSQRPPNSAPLPPSRAPSFDDDFFRVMRQTRPTAQPLTWNEIDERHRIVTHAISTERYVEGVLAGVALASLL